MLQAPNAATPVGRLVLERPGRARTLEKFGVDYCCGGRRSLAEACIPCGADLVVLLAALAEADAAADPGTEPDYAAWDLPRLLDHIVASHHAYLKNELPALDRLVRRVAEKHGAARPELVALVTAFELFCEDMQQHLVKEEQVFFPALRELAAGRPLPKFFAGSLRVPIFVLEGDHRRVDQAMRYFRLVTAGYSAPPEACDAWRAMTARLRELEEDTHRHVHLEHELVHARAVELTGGVA
jgi:regulator of cell morphogenesis and NO signaling